MPKVVPRSEVEPMAWNNFVETHPDGWWFHTEQWLEYALAYTPGSADVSLARVEDDGRLSGVAPLVVDSGGDAVNGGQLAVYPLGDTSSFTVAGVGRPGQRLPTPPMAHTYVVDLRQDLASMWTKLRGSYKPLINRASKTRAIQTFSGCGDPGDDEKAAVMMGAAMDLHLAAAGRRTRSEETWRLQTKWLSDGHAVCSMAFSGVTPVGFAYAIRWKQWAYYASGASLEDNVQHALIWSLMVCTRAAGGHHFEVGHAADADADSKERSIAFFKAGFGGTEWPVAAVIR